MSEPRRPLHNSNRLLSQSRFIVCNSVGRKTRGAPGALPGVLDPSKEALQPLEEERQPFDLVAFKPPASYTG